MSAIWRIYSGDISRNIDEYLSNSNLRSESPIS